MAHAHPSRLTLAAVQGMPAGTTLWDSDLRGFGVRRQRDTPTYFLKTRIRGRQRWITIGRHGAPWTPQTARQEAIRLLAGATRGEEIRTKPAAGTLRPTVALVAERFLAEHGPKLKATTRREYKRTLDKIVLPKLGNRRMDDIGVGDISKLHVSLKDTPRQANFTLTVLSSFFAWAMQNKLMAEGTNPCQRIRRFKENRRERYLTAEELTRLAAALDHAEAAGEISVYAAAAIRLLVLTGARLSEILTLIWSEVHLERGVLKLRDSKTGAKTIHLSEPAQALLSELPRLSDNPHVICGAKPGSHLINLHQPWALVREAAGLENLRLHDLRHSYASFAADSGASLPVIGKLLGHNQPQTTARYAHLTDAPAKEATRRVGQEMAKLMLRRR